MVAALSLLGNFLNLHPTNLRVGSVWLCDEFYLTETGFELHVLLDNPLIEFTISAENVNIEVIS